MKKNSQYGLSSFPVLVLFLILGCGEPNGTPPKPPEPKSEEIKDVKTEPKEEKRAEEQQPSGSKETVSFPSGDELAITADLYRPHHVKAPFIVLFHQARWSRGEYLEIAPKLNKLGFNCMAVDQRSGGEVNEVVNETNKKALEAKKEVTYLDAYQDMVAAVKYAKSHHAKGELIVWGSSYSASLVFRLAAEHPDEVNGLLAFAPGEYFEKLGAEKDYVTSFAAKVSCPVFVTSAKKEASAWKGIYEAVKSDKSSFIPETEGKHGSSTLWEERSDSASYWVAVREFLRKYKTH